MMSSRSSSTGTMKHIIRIFLLILTSALVFLLLFLTRALDWAVANFGNIGMEQILFTIHMPLEGSGSGFIQDFLRSVLLPALLIFLILAGLTFMLYRILRSKLSRPFCAGGMVLLWCLCGLWIGRLVRDADRSFGFLTFIENQMHQSYFIEKQFKDPQKVPLTFPEQKRNLVYILLESGESSNQDKDNGGLFDVNYIPNMTQLAQENVSFSQSERIEGAAVAPSCGWTAAGMVAQFAGVPLKLYSHDNSGVIDNSMGQYQSFLPGVTSLGELLSEQGYQNYFMCGSDVTFGGREKFLSQHGNYVCYDLFTARERGKIPSDYYVWWGFEDRKLYEYAKEELSRISQLDQPFNFTMLTVDTHHIGGYVCPLCPTDHAQQYGNVWSCADRQLKDFLDWCKEQPFYENTTFVIAGDHCSMDPEFYGSYTYDKHMGETQRKVYNCIINPVSEPVQEKNRLFVTLDLFPTTLGALGVEIEGDRLGLGTDLFSDTPTLSEEFGYEQMFDELNRRSTFYNNELLYPD